MVFAKPHVLDHVLDPPNGHPKWRNDQGKGQKLEGKKREEQISRSTKRQARAIMKPDFLCSSSKNYCTNNCSRNEISHKRPQIRAPRLVKQVHTVENCRWLYDGANQVEVKCVPAPHPKWVKGQRKKNANALTKNQQSHFACFNSWPVKPLPGISSLTNFHLLSW